jgi:hypothetical protein
MRSHSRIRNHSRFQLEQRIRRKGAVEHLDFFEQLIDSLAIVRSYQRSVTTRRTLPWSPIKSTSHTLGRL